MIAELQQAVANYAHASRPTSSTPCAASTSPTSPSCAPVAYGLGEQRPVTVDNPESGACWVVRRDRPPLAVAIEMSWEVHGPWS